MARNTLHEQWWKPTFIFILITFAFLGAQNQIEGNLSDLLESSDYAIEVINQLISGIFNPALLVEEVKNFLPSLFDTLAMSVAGTFLGVIFAVPSAFLATHLVTENRIITLVFRFFFSIIRTLPNLLLAAVFVAMVGIGQASGLLTIALFTFGMVSQLLFEAIETVDKGPIEANKAIGATRFQIARYAVLPQVATLIWNYALYAFEVNIRASAVLGYVGAGGIGTQLQTAMAFLNYQRVGIIILMILILVTALDQLAKFIRKEVL